MILVHEMVDCALLAAMMPNYIWLLRHHWALSGLEDNVAATAQTTFVIHYRLHTNQAASRHMTESQQGCHAVAEQFMVKCVLHVA